MKVKPTLLSNKNKKCPFISIISPTLCSPGIYTLTNHTTYKSILIEPYVNYKNWSEEEDNLALGSNIYDLIYSPDTNYVLEPYTENIPTVEKVFIKIKDIFDVEDFFRNMKYISLDYSTEKYEIAEIYPKKSRFYKISEDSAIYFSNEQKQKLVGYQKDINIIQKMIYTGLFQNQELTKHNLKFNNVFILQGVHEIKKKAIFQEVAYNLNANHLHFNFENESEEMF